MVPLKIASVNGKSAAHESYTDKEQNKGLHGFLVETAHLILTCVVNGRGMRDEVYFPCDVELRCRS